MQVPPCETSGMADDNASVSDRALLERMRAGKGDSTVYVWLIVPLATLPAAAAYGERGALIALLGSLALCVRLLQLRDSCAFSGSTLGRARVHAPLSTW
jgi:hypothetical protein